jgi:hypothetical protein
MADSRLPGPVGRDGALRAIDEGTLIRADPPAPRSLEHGDAGHVGAARVRTRLRQARHNPAFRLKPKLEALYLPSGSVFRFPNIEGEAIGQEWWHYELKGKKGWMELIYAIGWTKEGLMNTPQPG